MLINIIALKLYLKQYMFSSALFPIPFQPEPTMSWHKIWFIVITVNAMVYTHMTSNEGNTSVYSRRILW
jgi:hypothetical protein